MTTTKIEWAERVWNPITQGADGKLIVALELEPTQGEEAA